MIDTGDIDVFLRTRLATGHVAVSIASGGHPPALLLRADGTAGFLATPGGLLVGILPDAHFTPAATTLAPGDNLLLYTDGLTEARTGEARTPLYGTRPCKPSPPATPAGPRTRSSKP